VTSLSKDSLAILLLCSDLAMPSNSDCRPFTLKEWQVLSYKLKNSPLGRPQSIFESAPEEWRTNLELTNEQVVRIQKLLARGGQLGIELERLESLGIWVTTRAEAGYPLRLKQVLMQKSPVILFGAGDRGILDSGGVAIVGSRKIDYTATVFTERLAEQCAGEKMTVISGGANGVDSIAQDTAIKAGGKVIAVLADRLEASILRKDCREAIMAGQLLLMSSFHPRAGFKVYTAMERNKYVYALSNYAVVVSSSVEKGGTWAGATENLRARWVPLFVRSGKDAPAGNEKLIGQGGIPIDEKALSNGVELREWLMNHVAALPQKGSLLKEDGPHYQNNTGLSSSNWSALEKELQTPKEYHELAEILKVSVSEVKKLLKQALNEGKVTKLTRPVRFELVRQRTIFDSEADQEN
jgi:predicted Rossmann fold nucleotide-binding protein DprA/Smf involved in DNA uptake